MTYPRTTVASELYKGFELRVVEIDARANATHPAVYKSGDIVAPSGRVRPVFGVPLSMLTPVAEIACTLRREIDRNYMDFL